MNPQQIVIGIVGIIVGFILGFFVAQGVTPGEVSPSQPAGQLPENHPKLEISEQLQGLIERAQSDPADHEVRVAIGNAFYDMGRYDAAIPWYKEALALHADDAGVSTDLGTSYLATGAAEQALEQYRRSLELEPEHPQTLQNMGFAFFSTGDYQEAIDSWEHLLEAHPEYAHADEIREQMRLAQNHLETDAPSQ
ncbi:MAG TPA: tetratricopeptide repeat protein [Acidobacteriota bacterium]|nr:tetratricopeptide repeat protein [Acidobacteriota bacterium]